MDFISSDSITKESYHIGNKKIYTRNQFYYKLSNTVQKFNAENFAKWMQDSFVNSKFKKQIDLVRFVKSNPATISRLMTGTAQTVNGKPSQPDKELVIKLAEAFEQDIDEVLVIAGYAPLNGQSESKDFADVRVSLIGGQNYSEKQKEDFFKDVEIAIAIAKRRLEEERKKEGVGK